jgi:hypothetical protein
VANALDPFLASRARVSSSQFSELCSEGRIIEKVKRTGAVKVVTMAASDGSEFIIKLWHPDGWLSSGRIHPYSVRFCNNAARLRELGFQAPLVRGWGRIGSGGIRFICYEALPGRDLRELKPDVDLPGVARFIAGLHDAGVDFRSLHLGNLLWEGGKNYSLIDVSDCSFLRAPLSLKNRSKRLAYLCCHRRDVAFWAAEERWADFLLAYSETVNAMPSELLRHARAHPNWERLSLPEEVPEGFRPSRQLASGR